MGAAIPMTVVGGFLGAGKTTLLNRLLAQAAGTRFAVLVNDFGDLAIDDALITAHDGDTIALANGCICCTLGDDLLLTVMRLLDADPTPEHIVVEASGIADPRPIADIAVLHKGLARDAVCVVVDAEQVLERPADTYVGDTVLRQLAAADVVVLNKCDLVDTETRRTVRAWLDGHAPEAAIIETTGARVPAGLLFGAGPAPQSAGDERGGHSGGQAGGHGHADHTAVLRAAVVHLAEPIDEARFRRFVAGLPRSVLRAKGLLRFSAEPARVRLFQMVGRRYEITAADEAPSTEMNLVFLGTPEMPAEVDFEARLERGA